MTDKLKRIHSPNRRRKFLLMIVLPTVALMVGFMVLSPQINAWLATDPFTPPCHFEEDRLFVTGHPLTLGSVNDGLYSDIETHRFVQGYNSPYFRIKWSPDGEKVYYHLTNYDIEENYIHVVADDREMFINRESIQIRDTGWSPNGRYLHLVMSDGYAHPVRINLSLYDTETNTYTDVIEKERERPDPTRLDEFSLLAWSDDSTSILIEQNGYKLYDVETGEMIALESEYLHPESIVTWSSDLKHFYYVYDSVAYDYSLEIAQETILLELPFALPYTTIIQSSDESTFAIVHQRDQYSRVDSVDVYYRDTNEFLKLDYYYVDYRSIAHEKKQIWGLVGDELMMFNLDTKKYEILPVEGLDHLWLKSFSPSYSWVILIDGDRAEDSYMLPMVSNTQTGRGLTLTLDDYYPNDVSWLEHNGKEYVVFSEFDEEQWFYRLYLIDPETTNRCIVGVVGQTVAFQPQG